MAELVMIITIPTPVLVWRGSQESIAKVSTEERFCLIRVRRLHSSFIRNINSWNQAWTALNHAKQSQRKLLINSLLTRSFQLNAHNITHWEDLEPLCRAEQKYHQNIVLHHYYFTNSSTEKAAFTCYHKQYTRKCLSFSFTLSYQDEKNYLDSRAMLRHLYPFQIIHLTIQSKFTTNSLISFSYNFHHGGVTWPWL